MEKKKTEKIRVELGVYVKHNPRFCNTSGVMEIVKT
jgi:hypothetical protein